MMNCSSLPELKAATDGAVRIHNSEFTTERHPSLIKVDHLMDATNSQPRTLSLVLLGHGKMGKVLATLAPQRGFSIACVFDEDSNRDGQGVTAENFRAVDVAVDFTTPTAALENIRKVAALGCNLVVGTTGWTDHLDEVRKLVSATGVGLVYGANFSIGVQLFYRVAKSMAQAFAAYPVYEPYLIEAHHRFKKDAPSGTALELKRQVSPYFESRDIPITSVRAGYHPGMHEMGFDSEADTVILRHTSRSRQGFAEGALYAARWVAGKKGVFAFADILE
jgi:4-hydroxy-tetrahydrodipicolinate reductase